MKLRYDTREDAAALYGILEDDLVLDVGCGPGDRSQYYESAVSTYFQRADVITDVIPQLAGVHKDRKSFAEKEGQFYPEFVLSSVESLPFKDKSFQFVWCAQILEHVDNPEVACKELMRVGERGQIRAPSTSKEFFRPNPDHKWLVAWEDNVLIFQRKPALFFHPVHRNLFHDQSVVEWYNMRIPIKDLPVRIHETTFDWSESFEVEVLN